MIKPGIRSYQVSEVVETCGSRNLRVRIQFKISEGEAPTSIPGSDTE